MGEMSEWALEQAEREDEANGQQPEESMSEKMRRALRDGTYWVNRHHEAIPLSKIDGRYAGNIVRMLDKLARALHNDECLETLFMSLPNEGTVAYDLVWGDIQALHFADPQEWMEDQPLYRNLSEKAARRKSRLARIVHGR